MPEVIESKTFDETRPGDIDALVFTAGIGENSTPVRAAVCGKLKWLGISLDEAQNKKNGPRISAPDSRVSVWVTKN